MSWIWIFISFFIVGLAQPDISPIACILASCLGYGLFWKGLLNFSSKTQRFFIAFFWFFGVSGIHLNWLLSDRYVGSFILIFLSIWLTFLALQFGLVSLIIKKEGGWIQVLLPASIIALFEYLRLHILSGYSWDPIGLALSGTLWGMQGVGLVGIFGLTFWIFVTNLVFLYSLQSPFKISRWGIWGMAAIVPYLYGFFQVYAQDIKAKTSNKELSVVLVQTSMAPEDKVTFVGEKGNPFTVYEQWKRILLLLKEHVGKSIDLIVLSESVVPYGTEVPLFPKEAIPEAFKEVYGMAPEGDYEGGNSAFAKAMAKFFNADVVIGLEDFEEKKAFNAAFLFSLDGKNKQRYEKRILIPMAEYIPFNWCKKFLRKYGIWDSYSPGDGAKVFDGVNGRYGVSICYEETFGHLMRESRLQNANLLINVSNDVWYPYSRLPMVHFITGRLRAIENGVPLVRSCNTGVTCAIDSVGRTLSILDYEKSGQKSKPGALYCKVPLHNYKTLYTYLGDYFIITLLSAICLISILSSTKVLAKNRRV